MRRTDKRVGCGIMAVAVGLFLFTCIPSKVDAWRGYKVKIKIAEDMPEVYKGVYGLFQYPVKVEGGVEILDKFYDKYLQPGLIFPYDISWEARQNLDVNEIMRRYLDGINAFACNKTRKGEPGDYYYPYTGIGTMDSLKFIRYKAAREWRRSYFDEKTGLGYKFISFVDYPEDSRGIGVLTINYLDPQKHEDDWLYLPGVRRVRRLSPGNKQDAFLGSVFTTEELLTARKDYTYKIIRSEKFKGRDKSVFTWHPNMARSRLNGVGQDCWVIELTPVRTWAWAKKIIWIEKKSFYSVWEEQYDKAGKLMRTFTGGFVSALDKQQIFPPCVLGDVKIEDADYSSGAGCEDLRTGSRSWYMADETIFMTRFPESILTTRTLEQQPAMLPERGEFKR